MANNISELSSASAGCCAKHPSLHLLPGVCSSCLRDRLHQLIVSPEINTTTAAYPGLDLIKSPSYSICSNSLPYDSSHPGGPWSPTTGSRRRAGQGRHKRNGSAASESGPVLVAVRVGGGGLRKSRSITSVAGRSDEEAEEGVKMVKRGFWSKLIRFKSGRSKDKESWSRHRHHSARTLRDTLIY